MVTKFKDSKAIEGASRRLTIDVRDNIVELGEVAFGYQHFDHNF
jgi:hypothetical protein